MTGRCVIKIAGGVGDANFGEGWRIAARRQCTFSTCIFFLSVRIDILKIPSN